MAKLVAVFVLALIAVAMAAPAEEQAPKKDLQTAQGIGLGYYGLGGYGLGYGLGYGGLYGGYGLGYGHLLHRGFGFYG